MAKTAPANENFSTKLLSWVMVIAEFLSVLIHTICLVFVSIFRVFVPATKKSVRSRNVLITGAAHGLGRRLALNFSSLGARVVLWDIDQDKNAKVLQEIKSKGGQAWAYKCDVSDEKQVEEVGQKVKTEVGDVHILINNAGVLPGKPIMYLNSYQIRRTLEINTLSHFWTIRQFLPSMLQIGEGHIVAVASIAGILGCANLTDYCASKFGVVGMMSALREDLYVQGREDIIHLTIACPATMDTGLVQRPRTRFPSLFPILKVDDAAEIITNGVLRNKRVIVIPMLAQIIFKIANLFPAEVPVTLQRFFEYTIEPNLH